MDGSGKHPPNAGDTLMARRLHEIDFPSVGGHNATHAAYLLRPHRTVASHLAERNSVTVDDILRDRDGQGGTGARAARRPKRTREELIAGQLEISERCAANPILDSRSPDEIIDYNDRGVFD